MADEEDYMLNLALQMSLEPDANTPVRPGPDEPKPTAEAVVLG